MQITMEEEERLRQRNIKLYQELQTLRQIGASDEEIRYAQEDYQRSSELYMRKFGILCEADQRESDDVLAKSKKRRMSKLLKGLLLSVGGLAAVIVVAVTVGELFSAESAPQKNPDPNGE